MKHKKFVRCSFFLLWVLLGLGLSGRSVWANISTTFHDSLPYVASGNYTWSVWDYLTNPYIYYLQEKDAISALITNSIELNRQDYTLAGRLSVLNVPIYYALGLHSPVSQSEIDNPSASAINKSEKSKTDRYRVMLGSHFGPKLLNLGIGGFAQIYREKQDIVAGPGGDTDTDNPGSRSIKYYEGTGQARNLRIPSKFGLELGQKLAGKTSPSWSLSLEYRIWGGTNEKFAGEDATTGREEFNDAPFLFFPNEVYIQANEVRNHMGNTRKEIFAHFLGWWPLPIGAASNAGLDVSFYLPSGSGRSNKSIDTARRVTVNGQSTSLEDVNGGNLSNEVLDAFYPTITLTGYGVNATLFYDQDFLISGSNTTFRLSPWLRYVDRLEELREERVNEKRDEIAVSQRQASLGISFKLNAPLTESEDLILYLGWRPSLLLFDETKVLQDTQTARRETKITNSIFKADLKGFTLGFTYKITTALNIHILASSTQEAIDVLLLDIAVDYQFGVE